jgi:hypothetical protein
VVWTRLRHWFLLEPMPEGFGFWSSGHFLEPEKDIDLCQSMDILFTALQKVARSK